MNAFLRPELAQNVFSNFPRLLDYYGGHLPFGCGIVGQVRGGIIVHTIYPLIR